MRVRVDTIDGALPLEELTGIRERLHWLLGPCVSKIGVIRLSLSMSPMGSECVVRVRLLNQDILEVRATGPNDDEAIGFGLARARSSITRHLAVARLLES